MQINADFSQRIVINHHELPWRASPELGVERRMLERQGDEVAKATSIVRYQPGSKFQMHIHELGEEIFVLEVNPRASRTVPFVAKSTAIPIAKIASLIMIGKKLKDFNLQEKKLNYFAVKEVVFPFARFSNVDIILVSTKGRQA